MPAFSFESPLPDATELLRGVVSTGAQTFGGPKTFADGLISDTLTAVSGALLLMGSCADVGLVVANKIGNAPANLTWASSYILKIYSDDGSTETNLKASLTTGGTLEVLTDGIFGGALSGNTVASTGGSIVSKTGVFSPVDAVSVSLIGAVADGANAVGVVLDCFNALSTGGSKLASVRNATVEKLSIAYDGSIATEGGISFSGNLSSTSTTSALYLNSARSAASTSAVSASLEIGTAVTLDANDLLVGFIHGASYVATIDAEGDMVTRSLNVNAGTGASATVNVGGRMSVQDSDVGNVGAGEDTLHSYTLPANSLTATGRGIDFFASGTFPSNANAKTLKAYFGSQAISVSLPQNESGHWLIRGTVVRTGLNAQRYCYEAQVYSATGAPQISQGDLTETETAGIVLKVTGEATADNDIVQKMSTVRFI